MFWQEFKNGGAFNYLILLFGCIGVLAGAVCALLAARRDRFGRVLGMVVVGLAFVILSTGVAGVLINRATTDAASAAEATSAATKDRIKRAGYAEANSCAKFGLGFAAIPLLAGIAAIVAAKRDARSASALPGLVVVGVTLVPMFANSFFIAQDFRGPEPPVQIE